MHPNRTKLVLENIRDQQLKGDAISSVLDEIIDERDVDLTEEANNLLALPFASVREEMMQIINDGLNGYSNLARILGKMDAVKAYDLLTLLDDVDENQVLEAMSVETRNSINQEKNKDMNNTQRLLSLSEIYQSKSPESLVDVLGSTSQYSISELAIIFKELGVLKTGEILSATEDDEFVNSIITEMKNNEILSEGEDLLTKDILKTLKIHKDFDDNILKLTNIYASMESEDVSRVLSDLMNNRSLPEVYVLDSGDIITISDEDLAYEILGKFDDTRIAEIIGFFDERLASEVTRKLIIPNE
jgi:Mg/Co/Ni transporter MgtE